MATSTPRRYSQVLQTFGRQNAQDAMDVSDVQLFSRETEVVAKLPLKRTRQYIYDLLSKVNYPFKNIECIVERRGGMVDFTCGTVDQAKHLAASLERHKGVEFARLVYSEYTDVKVHWVPGRFPNHRIVSAIEKFHGKVHESRMLRDRHGIADGRRLYRVKTEDLKAHPIAPTVRMEDMVFLVEYSGQPVQCFLCKGFGHIRNECPNAVTTPSDCSPTSSEMPSPRGSDEKLAEATAAPAVESMRDITQRADSARDKVIDAAVLAIDEPGLITKHSVASQQVTLEKTEGVLEEASTATKHQEPSVSNLLETMKNVELHLLPGHLEQQSTDSVSSSERDDLENPDPSIFATDDEDAVAGVKRQHSPDEVTTVKKTSTSHGENVGCACGQTLFISYEPGCYTDCTCGVCHVRCTCKHIAAAKGSDIAYCTHCHKSAPRRNLDVTV